MFTLLLALLLIVSHAQRDVTLDLSQDTLNSAGRDVTLQLSQDALNSAGVVYNNAGKLTKSGVLPDNTTTAVLHKLIPKAYALCPDCPISFTVSATTPPKTSITATEGATLTLENAVLNLTAAKTFPTNSPINELLTLAFNASCGLNFSATPLKSGDYVTAKITILKIHLVVLSSNVGILPNAAIALLDPLVNAFLEKVAIPAFNKEFPGFPLPSVSGFAISDFLITTNDGYISVGLDISSAPPAMQLSSAKQMVRKLMTPRTNVHANPPGFSGPGVVATVGGAGLNKLLKGLIPEIISKVNGLVIPAMSGKASGISYSIGAITISGFVIGTSSIQFVEGKGLELNLGNLGLQIPSTNFDIKKKILFTHISCSGHFSGSLGQTSVGMSINISATEPAGTPVITPVSTWTWGSLGVNVKLNNVFCKIIKDIASWFIGNINHKIEDVIKSKVPPLINNLIQKEGNKILSALVLNKKLSNDAEVTYYLTQNPTSANDALSVYLSGEFVKPTSERP